MDLERFYHDNLDAITLAAILPHIPMGEILHVSKDVSRGSTGRDAKVTAEASYHVECLRRADTDQSAEWKQNKRRLESTIANADHVSLRPHSFGKGSYCALCWQVLEATPIAFRKVSDAPRHR